MSSNMSSLYAQLANHLKPHRAEALQRVRVNGICLVTGILVSYLLPIPSLHRAIHVVRSRGYDLGSGEWFFYRWFCILGASLFDRIWRLLTYENIEVAMFSLFLVNLLHGIYAVRYPRTSYPPVTSPSKPRAMKTASVTPQRSFKVLSPQVSHYSFPVKLDFSTFSRLSP